MVGLLLRQFSKLVVSATHPPHHWGISLICGAKLIRNFESAKFFAEYFIVSGIFLNFVMGKALAVHAKAAGEQGAQRIKKYE